MYKCSFIVHVSSSRFPSSLARKSSWKRSISLSKRKEKEKRKETTKSKCKYVPFDCHDLAISRAEERRETIRQPVRLSTFLFFFFFSYTLVIQPVKYRGAREVRSNARSEVAAHLLSSARCSARCFAVRGGNGAARIPRKTAMHQRRSFPRMSTREAYKVKDKQRKFPLGVWTRSCLRSIN